MANWKIEPKAKWEKDPWLDGYGAVAATVGIWGCIMFVATKIANSLKVTKKTDEENDADDE